MYLNYGIKFIDICVASGKKDLVVCKDAEFFDSAYHGGGTGAFLGACGPPPFSVLISIVLWESQ